MILRPSFCALAFVASITPLFAEPATAPADRSALINGVKEIATGGAPGPVCVFGPDAFAVVAGKEGKESSAPVVAAAHWEKGRVVAFGHGGFLDPKTDSVDTEHLILNAVRWTAGVPANGPFKVGVFRLDDLSQKLKADGLDVQKLDGAEWSQKLAGLRVLLVDSHSLGDKEVQAVTRFVREGGGLVTAGLGWGWQQLNPNKKLLTDHPGNRLLAPAGIVWGSEMVEHTGSHGYVADLADPALLNAGDAFAALQAHQEHKATLDHGQLAQAAATVSQAMRDVPPTDKLLLPRLASLQLAGNDLPSPEKPLKADNALGRVALAHNLQLLSDAKPEQIRAHPAAASFPGTVPTDAPRINGRTVAIDGSRAGWASTGLYAAPGELVRVEVPAQVSAKGLSVRIGCHNDTLWHLDAWKRVPAICKAQKITTQVTPVASPFGGLLYIEIPSNAGIGPLNVTISGAVEAPRYVLGKTRLDDWRSHLRAAAAPWAELETSKVILSIPSKNIRNLDDPEALMKFWDKILDAEADLATIPRERARPERIVADVQISAGYMHSGYPIMTPLDSVENAVNLAKLQAGSWGHFHELGHNHQQPTWTFDGTTEVTCNLFSLYVSETLCGQPPGQGHDAMKPAAVEKRLRTYLSGGADFSKWKSDPFLALIMYSQLRQGFGWDPYKKVFAEYRALSPSDRPKTDDERRDQWLIRFSKAAGKNLGPFFQAWGMPVSQTARDAVKDLPAWMPTDWPTPQKAG